MAAENQDYMQRDFERSIYKQCDKEDAAKDAEGVSVDVSMQGHLGFYSISSNTPEAECWCSDNVQGFVNGSVCTDDTGMAMGIAQGALNDGLVVEVNGRVIKHI